MPRHHGPDQEPVQRSRPPHATPSTLRLYRGSRLLGAVAAGAHDIDPPSVPLEDAEAATACVHLPARWRDRAWFEAECETVWSGLEIRRL